MESWKGHNYYTTDHKKWVQLMNLSTQEWRIGYLPAKLVAIPGKLNSSYDIADDAILIQEVAQDKAGSRATEKIIFGVASGIVLLFMFIWIVVNWKNLSSPNGDDGKREDRDSSTRSSLPGTLEANPDNDESLEFRDFCRQLRDFYYFSDRSELEAVEKDMLEDRDWVGDLETASALLRKVYRLELRLRFGHNSAQMTPADRNKINGEKEALLAEVNRLVQERAGMMRAQHLMRADGDEMEQMEQIEGELSRLQPEQVQRWDDSQRSRDSRGSRNLY
ncbi:hypothetical protein FALBO_5376 [Fusarium albosuccineum]|uniref:Uncharacterized protein n=1 Tax=Fusarium albosuccineum TaxID=1237068 RepID=A0A8H4PCR5_9HYPO|nr:hypothetical protein FALBO_5376 [Fusarium albosuccineum]